MKRTHEQLLARKKELMQRLEAIRSDLRRGLAADAEGPAGNSPPGGCGAEGYRARTHRAFCRRLMRHQG